MGLAAYLVGITSMWSVLRRPTVIPWLIAAAVVTTTPWLVGRPAIEALGLLITVTGLPVVAHALTPAIRAHRQSVRHETHHAPAH